MGSLYTSIIPDLLSTKLINAIDNSRARVMYVCNMMTQPGETDDFKVSDHVRVLNQYLGKKKIGVVIANNGDIPLALLKKYSNEEQKDKVLLDMENLNDVRVITANYVTVVNNVIRHKVDKLSVDIYNYLLEDGE